MVKKGIVIVATIFTLMRKEFLLVEMQASLRSGKMLEGIVTYYFMRACMGASKMDPLMSLNMLIFDRCGACCES